MAKKSVGTNNPLATVLPGPDDDIQAAPAPRHPEPARQPVMFKLTPDTANRARNAVFWSPGLTMNELAENALREHLDRLEKKRGEPFPQRTKPLAGGRLLRSS